MTFTHTTTRTPATFTNVTSNRTTLLPRFERNNLQSNLYNYRSEVITPYISGIQDGVYHIYTLSADKAVPTEFTDIKYSQNVVDLYPQLDRDNINDNPPSAKSFAKRDPLGEVVTNDLKKSITKESTDTLLTSFGIGLDVSNVSGASNETITFAREHGLAGIVTYSGALNNGTNSSGYAPEGIYQNLKLLNTDGGTWQGATARVVVSGGGNVASADIVSSGSGYSAGTLFFDSSVFNSTGNGTARFNIATSGITTAIGNVVQFTGAGTTSDTYHRITAVSADNQISIAKTAGDSVVTTNQYAFIVGPSVQITTTSYSSGVRTFNCSGPHGLVAGNRFRVTDSSNNNQGDYIVKDRVDFDTFTALTPSISVNGGYILKHGLSANNASSDSTAENLSVRSITLFDKETLVADSAITATTSTIVVSNTYVALTKRLPLGSYIQIDEEIMRVASSTPSTPSGSTFGISVIRGALATRQVSHDSGSLIRKIKPISIEFRRPSIVRASGHTFEYLGYGPGNYSTGLPQVQSITLTEREEFLVQSQERSGGIVVYTGMNNNGDSFVGNRKTSSSTGEEVTFDNPIPTITGEDPSRLSAVFDEVTVKERLVVEGGNSGTVLSQFDGPVTFNKEVKFADVVNVRSQLKVSSDTQSTTTANGALVVSGGVGIAKNLNVGGTLNVTGNIIGNVTGNITGNVTGDVTGTATNANNINISATTSTDTSTSIVLVANQSTGNQSPFIDSGLSYNADTNALTATTFIGNLTGIAASATQLQTSRTFTITGVVDAPAVSFDGTGNVELVTTLDDTSITTAKIAPNAVTTAKIDFTTALVPIGGIIMWSGSTGSIPTGYQLCNGSNGTPNLQDRFIVGAGSGYGVGAIGGENTVQLTEGQLAYHAHGIGGDGSHNHLVVNSGVDSDGDFNTRLVDNGGLPHIIRRGAPNDGQNHKYALRGTASGPDAGRSNDAGTHSHGGATVPAGSNQAHENRPPYYALAYIMRTS
jgi:microcystin-dependent protein